MSLTVDGNNVIFDGTVTIVNGFNEATGTAYLILTPNGGYGTLPFMSTGQPGLPPVFDSIKYVEIDPSQALPTPNPVVTLVNPGGAGTASHYTMTIYGHAGEPGASGSNTLSTATDLSPTPPLGAGTDGYTLAYNYSSGSWVPTPIPRGAVYVPTKIDPTAYDTTNPRLLASVNIPAKPYAWVPRCFGSTVVTGSSDTRVDLVARLNNQSSGDQVGYSKGIAGAAPPPNVLMPAAPAGSNFMTSNYGVVPAGQQATIFLRAEQEAPSTNSWSTPGDPGTTFWVEVNPIG